MMRRALHLAAILCALSVALVQSHAQQQPSPQELERMRAEQARQEAERRAAEQRAREAEAERQKFSDSLKAITPVDLAKSAPPQIVEPCLTQAMRADSGFDLKQLPLTTWLAEGNTTQFPWKVQVRSPQLRTDQRYEVAFNASVESKDLHWSQGPHELRVVTGVSSMDDRWLVPPKSGREVFPSTPPANVLIQFTDCLFVQPGDYVLWVVLSDSKNARHNVIKRRIRVSQFPADLWPAMNSKLPAVEFPLSNRNGRNTPAVVPGTLALPLQNDRRLRMELIPILNPSDQWAGRADMARRNNNQVLSATGVLSQLRMPNGSISVRALDLVNQLTVLQRDLQEFNWTAIGDVFTRVADNHTVALPALEALKQRSNFVRNLLRQQLSQPGDAVKVIVLISGTIRFEPGSDMSPLKLEGDCICRIYHLHFRINHDDVFDDLIKLIRPLRPRLYEITTPMDFRKAVVDMVEDLSSL
jgi:hypothetical protein